MTNRDDTFEAFVARERDRLQRAKEDALSRRAKIAEEITEIEREMRAITAYEQAKRAPSERKTTRTSRGRRGEKRQQLLDLIKSVPEGLSRGELIERLNAVEKSAQQSISNALSALFKQKAVTRKGGKYVAS